MNKFEPLVSTQWLASHLNDPDLVIVDCRFQLAAPEWGYQQYLSAHIPGAYYLDLDRDLSSPVSKHGGRHPLPDPTRLANTLGAMGVCSGKTRVIAYDSSRFAFASRLWWLLRYLGHNQVALLDGGWNAWLKDSYPVTTQLPTPKPGTFTPQPQQNWLVDIQTLKQHQPHPSSILIDCRESDRYRGEREPIDPIAGHIPGAVNSPWQLVSDEQGYLRPLSEQQSLWEPYKQAEEIILYCGSGVTACVNLFSLELAGYKNVKLYAGGWSDWCSYLV